jgi:hypothetical protein
MDYYFINDNDTQYPWVMMTIALNEQNLTRTETSTQVSQKISLHDLVFFLTTELERPTHRSNLALLNYHLFPETKQNVGHHKIKKDHKV